MISRIFISAISLLIILSACAAPARKSDSNKSNFSEKKRRTKQKRSVRPSDCPARFADKKRKHAHISNLQPDSPIIRNHRTLPREIHVQFHEARKAYARKNVKRSIEILAPLTRRYPWNPYFLNALARAHYRNNPIAAQRIQSSFKLYKKLVRMVDRAVRKQDGARVDGRVIIVPDFAESYWKLGTLYMDLKDFKHAHFFIARSLLTYITFNHPRRRNPRVLLQMYSYLTETSFFLKNRKLNRYYAGCARAVYPGASYIKKFEL